MSPTEDELRAALRDGAGETLDTDTVIMRARAHGATLHERRVRWASAAAVVAVVAGLGVGGGLVLSRHSSTNRTNATSDRTASGAGNAGGQALPSPQYALQPVCPVRMPTPTTPTRGAASLFDGPVAVIDVCLYANGSRLTTPTAGASRTPDLVISGAQTQQLITSIDSAATVEQALPCPLYRTASALGLVLIGVGSDGTTLPPVSTEYRQNPCNLPVTNGTAVRFNWQPPKWFSTQLDDYLSTVGAKR